MGLISIRQVAEKETRDTSLASDSPPPEGGHNFTDSGFENGSYDNSSEQSSECLLVEAPYMEVQDHQGGEMYYQQSYTDSQLPQGFTTSLPEAIALAPDTIVVEHYPAPVVVQEQYESWGHKQEQTEVSWSAGLGINIPVMSEGNFTDSFDNNTPTYSATYTSPSPRWLVAHCHPPGKPSSST